MAYKIKDDGGKKRKIPPAPGTEAARKAAREREKATRSKQAVQPPGRLVSLDAFRGFVMILLVAAGFGIPQLARTRADSPLWQIFHQETVARIAFHFQHPPWQSSFVWGTQDATVGSQWLRFFVSFWDLVQPAFLFMVGAAMPFSYQRREAMGQVPWKRSAHALIRALVLVLLGVFLYSLGYSQTHWTFLNVLAQIGLGYGFVYLLLGRQPWIVGASLFGILVVTWGLMQFVPPLPYDPGSVHADFQRGEVFYPPFQQWSKNGNAFHRFDVWFLNLFPRPEELGPFLASRGGYQTLNFLPSIGTMLLGLLCGQLLIRPDVTANRKLLFLLLAAVASWGLGVILGATCCPVVKRIWTPSWVLFSGGYVMALLALFYLLFDLLPFRKLAFPLVVVGMNSLLAYLLGETLREWLAENVQRHFGWAIEGTLGRLAIWSGKISPEGQTVAEAGQVMCELLAPVIASLSALAAIWLLCWWLYRQRIFVRV